MIIVQKVKKVTMANKVIKEKREKKEKSKVRTIYLKIIKKQKHFS